MVFGLFQKEESFDRIKLKTSLKMAVSRLQMQRNKKENAIKVQRREIAGLLSNGKAESARIKVEGLIRDEYMIEAFELVALFCELLSTRLQLIVEARHCPRDMKEGVCTLIWAAPRIENVPELLMIREQLARKFGVEFAMTASDNAEMATNQKVLYRLSMLVPEPYLCVERLKDIAAQYEVEWEPSVETLSLPASGLGAGIGTLPEGPIPRHQLPPGASLSRPSAPRPPPAASLIDFSDLPGPPPAAAHPPDPRSTAPSCSAPSPPPAGCAVPFKGQAALPTHNPHWQPDSHLPSPPGKAVPGPVLPNAPKDDFEHFFSELPPKGKVNPAEWPPSQSQTAAAFRPHPAQSSGEAFRPDTAPSPSDWPMPPVVKPAGPAPFQFDPVLKPQYPAPGPPPPQSPSCSSPPSVAATSSCSSAAVFPPGSTPPPPSSQDATDSSDGVDFSDLEARFAALKRL
eukprot:EG_transcript_10415